MTRPATHVAHGATLQPIAGSDAPIHRRIADVVAAAEHLPTTMSAWRTFAPRRASLDVAINQADAVARAPRELRQALHLEG